MATCSWSGCTRPLDYNKLCSMHRQRRQNGQPMDAPPRYGSPTVAYHPAHRRIYQLYGAAMEYGCVKCPAMAEEWAYDGTDPDQLMGYPNGPSRAGTWYSAWPEFYMPLCRSCHRSMDGSIANIGVSHG